MVNRQKNWQMFSTDTKFGELWLLYNDHNLGQIYVIIKTRNVLLILYYKLDFSMIYKCTIRGLQITIQVTL
jgi:hypothetical protein